MSVESTRKAMDRYFEFSHSDASMLSEDVVFTDMGTGQQYHGREGVVGMLDYIYHVAFDATAEPRTMIYSDNQAVGEWDLVGTHIGEFAGIPATGKSVRVPLCVVYDLENDLIKQGRIYFQVAALMRQLGMMPAMASQGPQ